MRRSLIRVSLLACWILIGLQVWGQSPVKGRVTDAAGWYNHQCYWWNCQRSDQ